MVLRLPLMLLVTFTGFGPATGVMAGEAPLVPLASIDASIRQDMRYAGSANFTGKRVPGYEAASCWLRPAAAKALARVEADLAKQKPPLGLMVFDCYRPQRSVAAFMAWAAASEDGRTRHYYPNLERSALVPRGYIGRASTHSRGIAVDLTLVTKVDETSERAQAVQPAPVTEQPCTRPEGHKTGAGEPSMDMGTAFDCFDPKSHTNAAGIAAAQRRARQTLKAAMERHGFTNYAKEWWHFTFPAADDGRSFDVPVR